VIGHQPGEVFAGVSTPDIDELTHATLAGPSPATPAMALRSEFLPAPNRGVTARRIATPVHRPHRDHGIVRRQKAGRGPIIGAAYHRRGGTITRTPAVQRVEHLLESVLGRFSTQVRWQLLEAETAEWPGPYRARHPADAAEVPNGGAGWQG
jgi:hypothetical protein